MNKISVGLLVYNEGLSLKETTDSAYKKLRRLNIKFELWIFDNKSSDNTALIVKKLLKKYKNLKYYKQKKHVGYALNFMSAIKIPNAHYKFVIDGDGQYDVGDIKKILKLLKNRCDLVFGIRKKRQDPFFRKFISNIFNFACKFIIRSNLKDINCGFVGFSKSVANKIKTNYKYNFIKPEIFALSKIFKFDICEVNVRHYKRKKGKSIFTGPLKIILNCYLMIIYLFQLRKILNKKITNEHF